MILVKEYTLIWEPSLGFILIDNKTMIEKCISEAEAFSWSKKQDISISRSADTRMDEILGFKTYGRTWRNINVDIRN